MRTEKRNISESIVETVHMVRPNHLNSVGRLFGGLLMGWMDEVAVLVAKRHTRMSVITASVDTLRFLKGAYQKDVIVIIGKATHVGTTSMEVKVESYVEDINGERTLINRAYFTMVALDEKDQPTEIPKLAFESEVDIQEWEGAEKRRMVRQMRKEEGF